MAITKEAITEALHRGVRAASKNYGEWSGGLTLAESPEYLIVVEIARNIRKKLGESERLRLEMQYADMLTGAGFVQGPGAPLKSIKGGQRADLVLLKNRHLPTCAIEVKKNPDHKRLLKDLGRLRDVVYACRHQRGVLKHGFLSIYAHNAESVVHTVDKFFDNRDRARVKRPNIRTWRRDDEMETSIVVEVAPAKN